MGCGSSRLSRRFLQPTNEITARKAPSGEADTTHPMIREVAGRRASLGGVRMRRPTESGPTSTDGLAPWPTVSFTRIREPVKEVRPRGPPSVLLSIA